MVAARVAAIKVLQAARGAASLGPSAMALALLTTPLLPHRAARTPWQRRCSGLVLLGCTAWCWRSGGKCCVSAGGAPSSGHSSLRPADPESAEVQLAERAPVHVPPRAFQEREQFLRAASDGEESPDEER